MQLVLLVGYCYCADFGSDANCHVIFVKRSYVLCLNSLFEYCFASSLVICWMSHRAAVEANRPKIIILFLPR
jgi:tellurite resistance protein TehA-like permease